MACPEHGPYDEQECPACKTLGEPGNPLGDGHAADAPLKDIGPGSPSAEQEEAERIARGLR